MCIPRGSINPALSTASAIEDASFLMTNCLGTPTLPAWQNIKINFHQHESSFDNLSPKAKKLQEREEEKGLGSNVNKKYSTNYHRR